MADPVTWFTVLSAASTGLQAVGQASQAMNESARYESEAKLAETQALQRDTQARNELMRTLSTVSAARAANGLANTSPNAHALEDAYYNTSTDERLRMRADDRQRAANFRTAAKSARTSAMFSLATGAVGAGIPIAQYKMK